MGAVRCFQLHRRRGSSSSIAIIRLIKSDGVVEIYERPITASEVMKEHPKHMVCRSDSFYIGQKTAALSHHDRLSPGQNYFLLPANFFQSALSFASFLRCPRSSSSDFQLEKTPSGGLRIKVTEDMIIQHHKQQVEKAQRIVRICTTPQLRKDYDLLVGRRGHWKPKLDTIAEKRMKKMKSLLLVK
ncbi:hypothetical protein PHJA_000448000 [Phtheirospermum japonicum]|uniref:Uncharacterized protein n=1 Tax=Phtheirospermum japonicum TaxID=374723 RepID=A0A830BCT5_9LAMI|nr:hypothetical protein PHJA_000448000 [Phtheirospermum japonicum]